MKIKVTPNENIDVTKLLSFFELLHKEKNASKEEVYNFSRACLEYVFKLHNIDLKTYTINLHFKKLDNDNDGRSYVEQSAKDEKTFNVYLDANDSVFKLKPICKTLYYDEGKSRNVNKNQFHNSEYEYLNALTSFSYFLNTLLHEYAHIVQYIKVPNLIAKSDLDRYLTGKNIEKYLKTVESNKERKLQTQQFLSHYMAKDFIRLIEKDANRQATIYTDIMLRHLVNTTKDFNLKMFIYNLWKVSRQIRKEDYFEYRCANKKNKQAIKILNEHNVPEDCFLCF